MTSIDELRDAVIEAARRQAKEVPEDTLFTLHDAINALDEAEKPDPWALLRETHAVTCYGPSSIDMADRITKALAWKEQNG